MTYIASFENVEKNNPRYDEYIVRKMEILVIMFMNFYPISLQDMVK